MTDHVPDIHPTAAPPAPAAGTAAPVAGAPAAAAEPAAGESGNPSSSDANAAPAGVGSGSDTDAGATTDAARPAGSGKRRGGRNRRKDSTADAAPAQQQQRQQHPSPQAEGGKTAPRGPRPIPPALEQLAALYPQLFGAVFRPLKRGIFQDLMAAHPQEFEREALKVALGVHTRSTRYLQSVAAGQQRHDLQGQPVEAMAPEHIHQALLEVHRRRSGRGNIHSNSNAEDLLVRLRARIVANIEASGLSREAYAERVRTRDAAANALLDQALADMAAKTAREEALVRAFETSGKTVEAFADMYGMDPRSVSRSLHSARARAAAEVAAQQHQQHPPQSRGDSAPEKVAAAPVDPVAPSAPAAPAAAKGAAPTASAAPVPAAPSRRRLWCLRSRMAMTPPAPRLGRWS